MVNSRLNISVVMEDHNLYITDKSDYSDWDCKHLLVRYIVKRSFDDVVVEHSVVEVEKDDNKNFYCEVPSDGLYLVYEILVPVKEHPGDNGIYCVYNEESGKYKIYLNNDPYDPESYEDFNVVYKAVVNDVSNNCFWFDGYTFTLSDLITCFIKLETELITEFAKNCKLKCSTKYTDLESKLTLLSAAITTIDYLLQSNNWNEAQEILEKITSCSSLCDSDKSKNSCGCGRTL